MPVRKVLAPTTAPNLIGSVDGITYTTFTPTVGPATFRNLLVSGLTVYALDGVGQIWQSLDFGTTWTTVGVAAPNGTGNANSFFRTSTGIWLLANGVVADTVQIQRSTTNGTTWSTVRPIGVTADNWFSRYFFEVPAAGLLTQRTIYLGVDDNTAAAQTGIWQSTDDGATWTQKTSRNTAAVVGYQFTRGGFYIVFSSVMQTFGITRPLGGGQFAYAPSTNPDASGAQVTRGDGGGAFMMEGTDGVIRTWSTGADEFHGSEANSDVPTWTAGALAVANGPSYGGVVVKNDIFFGANVALAHYVLSTNHGTSWTDTGLAIGPGVLAIAILPDPSGFNKKLRSPGDGGRGLGPSGLRFPRYTDALWGPYWGPRG